MATRLLQKLKLRLLRGVLGSTGVSIHQRVNHSVETSRDGLQIAGKALAHDTLGRFQEIVSDPVNLLIDRAPRAGQVSGDLVTLHNGLSVPISGKLAYYGSFSDILIINRGVHEPLEEFVFQRVLSLLPSNAIMLELGAYWGHYSMWMKSVHKQAQAYMVEPNPVNLVAGKANFDRNRLAGTFIKGSVGDGQFVVDEFMKERSLAKLNILHSDIQGAELQMLRGARKTLLSGKVDYCFVSTHSQKLHNDCMDLVRQYGYRIDVSSDFDEHTTSSDGLIFACRSDLPNAFEKFQPLGRKNIYAAKSKDILKSICKWANHI